MTGYVCNGTNKAIALFDEKGYVVTRRIFRLKIFEDEKGKRIPGIFVEENTQLGAYEIRKLYEVLRVLSYETGLPLIKRYMMKGSVSEKINENRVELYKVICFKGPSSYDYSDSFGNFISGGYSGLYKLDEYKVVSDSGAPFKMIVRPPKNDESHLNNLDTFSWGRFTDQCA